MSRFFDWREGSDFSPSRSMNDIDNSLFDGLDMQSYWSATSDRFDDDLVILPPGPGTVHEENNATNMILDFFGLEPGATYLNNEDVTYAPYYGDSLDRAVEPGIIRHGRPAGSRP